MQQASVPSAASQRASQPAATALQPASQPASQQACYAVVAHQLVCQRSQNGEVAPHFRNPDERILGYAAYNSKRARGKSSAACVHSQVPVDESN